MASTYPRPVASVALNRLGSSFFASVTWKSHTQYRNVTTKAQVVTQAPPPHSLIPNTMLWRSLLITTVSAHRLLLSPALSLLGVLSKPRHSMFDVEKNPLLRSILKWTLYNHFCAGENAREVRATIDRIKSMGFKGVILTYAAEVVVEKAAESNTKTKMMQSVREGRSMAVPEEVPYDSAIEMWRSGVLETVKMIGSGDYLALKLTGAGPGVARALETGQPVPPQMIEALDDVCQEAVERDASILIDAEQHFVQKGIDRIAFILMRKYNRGEKAVVYNTYQAYLKMTPQVLLEHLLQAQDENITIGVKLVRGAYINSEPRSLINDTKEDTDNAYDMIARDILCRRFSSPGFIHRPFPRIQLFLATHNRASVVKAYEVQQRQSAEGQDLVLVHYGQLLGMADEVSCTLLQLKEKASDEGSVVPEAYKCLSWGTLSECLSYLLRRAVENRDAVQRTREEYFALRREAFRRLAGGKSHIRQSSTSAS
ncbi:unnamed protein product [Clonostachys rosea]|uniref:Proline dehydrogenase n=1 Tax=Bionectria ochroleuca TaxID=29856 RepID=A0ABY6V185_BIOOC|nr:unnamed protein product [Clonostachys rosea]